MLAFFTLYDHAQSFQCSKKEPLASYFIEAVKTKIIFLKIVNIRLIALKLWIIENDSTIIDRKNLMINKAMNWNKYLIFNKKTFLFVFYLTLPNPTRFLKKTNLMNMQYNFGNTYGKKIVVINNWSNQLV